MPLKTIDNLCRICVQESHTYKHIYDQYILDIRLFEIINDLCQLNIYLGDGLPEYICACCHSKLLEFQKFKQTSHEGKAALISIKMKLKKMNLEAKEEAARASASKMHSQMTLEQNWGSQQLPVDSIGQLLEVHIKEEPADITIDEPEDYSASNLRRVTSSYHTEQAVGKLGAESVIERPVEAENLSRSDSERSAVIGSAIPNSNSVVKTKKKCRKCFVPHCKNTTSGNADKGFVNVPLHRDRRIRWFKAARRELVNMPSYELYCCGDHFNLQEDTENYMYHKTMGVSLRIKKDVLPHIFNCQPDRAEAEDLVKTPTNIVKGLSNRGDLMPSSSAYTT